MRPDGGGTVRDAEYSCREISPACCVRWQRQSAKLPRMCNTVWRIGHRLGKNGASIGSPLNAAIASTDHAQGHLRPSGPFLTLPAAIVE